MIQPMQFEMPMDRRKSEMWFRRKAKPIREPLREAESAKMIDSLTPQSGIDEKTTKAGFGK